jgi:hypothetical protein
MEPCRHTHEALVKAEDRHKPPSAMFHRDRALRDLMANATKVYNAIVKSMLGAIREYLEDEVVKGPLGKAGPPMPPGFATPAQLARIREIIARYHNLAVVEIVGARALSPQALAELRREGLLPRGVPNEQIIDAAYDYGRGLGGQLPGPDRQRYQATTLTSWQTTERAPLSPTESASLDFARARAGQYITGLTDRVGADINGLTVEEGEWLRSQYRDQVEVGVAQRDAWRKVASRMGDATDDWSRDLQRVAATEMQAAHQAGVADQIRNDEGEDATVFKQPTPDACPDCIALHLTGGIGSPPRLFKLSELEANGTNVGRKRADWKPVVGTVHPWCACELNYMPDGFAFDDDGQMVPELLLRSSPGLGQDLVKSKLTMSASVPDTGCFVDVQDPVKRAAVEHVLATVPKQLFDRRVGVTYITLDYPRPANHLECSDLAYWTGNEIRISYDTPVSSYEIVIRHELSHGLNVFLFNQWNSQKAVTDSQDELYARARREGFVSKYARTSPIECHAEVTRLFIWEERSLQGHFPSQWALCHDAYKTLFAKPGGIE